MIAKLDPIAVGEAVGLIARHEGVIEVRLLNTPKGTVSGYFDKIEPLVAALKDWDGTASVYMVMNELDARLLARSRNRLTLYAKSTTTDADIMRRMWLLIDVDAVRPKGIAATDMEVAAALACRDDVVAWLRTQGWPEPMMVMSGNGGHALYPINEPNDEATTRLLEHGLKALAARFSTPAATVDTAVYNAARIVKMPGTITVKGDATPERPHRRAQLEKAPQPGGLVTREQLTALAAMAPSATPPPSTVNVDELNVAEEFKRRGLYRKALGSGKHAVTCPWDSEHSSASGLTETALFDPRPPSTAFGFRCQHAHCADRTIRDVYALLRGQAPRSPNGHHPHLATSSPAVSRIRFRAGSELDNTPVRYHVEDMLPAGMLAALGGKDGMGKTQLGMEIIKCTLTGQPLFGRFAVQQGAVYALFLDDPEFLVSERLAALGILDHPDLHVATENDVDMSQPRAMLAQLIEMLKAATPRPKFIFVDALYLFIPSGGQGDQGNSAGAMAPVIDAFNQVTRETGATLLLVAHDNKAGGDIAGSYAIRAGLKAILRVMLPPAVARQVAKGDEEARETSERMLQLNKLKTGRPASWYLRLDGPGQWTFHGGATAYQRATLPARVIENLWGREESTVEELAKDLHARPADVRRTCAELYLADQITRGERPRVDGKPGRGAEVYGLKSPPRVPARGDGTDSSGNYGTDRVGGNYGTDRSGEEVQEKLGDSAGGTLSVPPPSADSRAARPIRPVIPTEGYPSHNPAPPCPRHPITPVPDLCDACRRRVA